jgi:hypothetical protein
MAKISSETLRPYKSFTVFEAQNKLEPDHIRKVLRESRSIIKQAARRVKGKTGSFSAATFETGKADESVAAMSYRLELPVAWFLGPDAPHDKVNHLIVLLAKGKLLALCTSDKGLGRRFTSATSKGTYRAWSSLRPVSAGLLNALLSQRPIRTLWLSGLHRSVSVKADNKVLGGQDLRDALDPLGDQTYHFTSARSGGYAERIGAEMVGVSPHQAKVWIGPAHDWQEFIQHTQRTLDLVAHSKKDKAPIPIIAGEIDSLDEVKDAFDVGLLPPEQLAETDPETSRAVEQWWQSGSWSVVDTDGANFSLQISEQRNKVGIIKVRFAQLRDEWGPIVEVSSVEPKFREKLDEFVELCRQRDLLKVYYESQHTYSDGSFFQPRFRDMPFRDFSFDPFKRIDIDREKPYRDPQREEGEDPGRTGRTDDRSLFTWVWRKFNKGWLWCDDGAGEVADFIHLDTVKGKGPVLRLIHVKAAGSAKSARKIAVAPYEVVCSQALKNLRYLERTVLIDALRPKLETASIQRAWKNGNSLPNKLWFNLPGEIANTPYSELSREVVIVQPHVTRDMINSKDERDILRIRQLHALLNSVKADVNRLGANFVVFVPKAR